MSLVSTDDGAPRKRIPARKPLALRIRGALRDELMRKVVGGSLAAFAIKAASAGLSFFMFVALARVMSKADYGIFAFGFSLATFLALVALLGQRTLALRMVPVYQAAGAPEGALRGLLLYGYGMVLGASALVCLGLVLVQALSVAGAEPRHALVLSALLVLPMAVSDYQSGVYRGLGMIVPALLPRDVLWRVGVIVACIPALVGWRGLPLGGGLGAGAALALSSALLMGLVLVQLAARREVMRILLRGKRPVFHLAQWRHATLGLWINDILQTGAPNLALVLLGLTLAPEATAGFFAAIKTATLLNFFLMAANIVVAPQLSRLWHAKDLDGLRRVSAIVTIGATIPTALLFAIYVLAGHTILGLFGGSYHASYASLVVLGAAQLVNTLCGQSGTLMAMTGNERRLTRFVLISNVIPLAMLPFGVAAFGEIFGAVAIGVGTTLWNVQTVVWARKNLGVDTSIVGAAGLLLERRRA